MKIIIVGDGKVGFALSEQLSQEGHDITIIDNKNDVLQKSVESLDIIAIRGNGASYAIQKKAGVPEADLLIAATSSDEVNMVCCILAKRLGAKHTIARIRNPEYNEQMLMMKEDIGLSMFVNPEMAAADEISRLLSFPSALSVGTFADGKVYMVEFIVQNGNPLIGERISVIHGKYAAEVLISTVERDGEVYVPKGDFIIKGGDHIHVVGGHDNVITFLRTAGQREKPIRSAMIVGGGLITYYLSQNLLKHNIRVKIIDKNADKCMDLCDKIPKALIINGDGTDKALLDSEGIDQTDAFIALTDIDEENIIMSLYGAYKGVTKVITKINRMEYSDVIRKAGIDRVISPKLIATNIIVRYVRHKQHISGSRINTLYRIAGGKVEVVEFEATAATMNLNIPVSDLPLKNNVLLTVIVRNGAIIIPRGKNMIKQGDTLIVVTTMKQLEDINSIFG